ncbi:hypothetical protein AABD41_00020 [Staphylococcus pseudoxylosus]|uniref:hypothetical protein n=1 Tax=Staphylococcus pseudoxylosus TaxID=2282419 RepID=UPI00398AFFA5
MVRLYRGIWVIYEKQAVLMILEFGSIQEVVSDMWIITSIILGVTILLLISNSIKNDQIAALKYTIVYMASDEDIDKAMQEWKRFKGKELEEMTFGENLRED